MKQGKKWTGQEANELYAAVLQLKTTAECRRFFRDLCTPEEIIEMTDRWQAAKLLARQIDYREIADKLQMSTATVARVAQWLWRGMDGYKLALQRLGLMHHSAHTRGER